MDPAWPPPGSVGGPRREARVLEGLVLLGRLAMREPRAAGALADLLALAAEPLLALAGGAVDLRARVLPGRDIVLLLVGIPAGEDAVEVLGVRELLVDDHRRVRVRLHVLLEPAVVLEDVVHDPAQEGDVEAAADAAWLRR